MTISIRERYSWKKVEAPKAWRPRMLGEELVGFYGGRTTRMGKFGQYDVVLVHVPARGAFIVSGNRLIQLIDASGLDSGDPVMIRWSGHMKLEPNDAGEDRKMKLFEVFVVEGDKLSSEDMPQVEGFDQ